jgi:hypothetical protein
MDNRNQRLYDLENKYDNLFRGGNNEYAPPAQNNLRKTSLIASVLRMLSCTSTEENEGEGNQNQNNWNRVSNITERHLDYLDDQGRPY